MLSRPEEAEEVSRLKKKQQCQTFYRGQKGGKWRKGFGPWVLSENHFNKMVWEERGC